MDSEDADVITHQGPECDEHRQASHEGALHRIAHPLPPCQAWRVSGCRAAGVTSAGGPAVKVCAPTEGDAKSQRCRWTVHSDANKTRPACVPGVFPAPSCMDRLVVFCK